MGGVCAFVWHVCALCMCGGVRAHMWDHGKVFSSDYDVANFHLHALCVCFHGFVGLVVKYVCPHMGV